MNKEALEIIYNTQTHQNPTGVLVGPVGYGKTSAFNKITGKSLKTSNGSQSTTRSVFSCSSAFGNKFQILDTPGTSSDEDKLLHGLHLRQALIEGP